MLQSVIPNLSDLKAVFKISEYSKLPECSQCPCSQIEVLKGEWVLLCRTRTDIKALRLVEVCYVPIICDNACQLKPDINIFNLLTNTAHNK